MELPAPRRSFVLWLLAVLLVGGALGWLVTTVLDQDAASTPAAARKAVTTSTTAPASTTTTTAVSVTAAPSTAPAGPPCTAAAILQAIQNAGVDATSVAGVQCGNGWAGASYESPQAAGAALLKAQGGQWVQVDRGASCNDPSIPSAVHVYCTVS